MSAVILLFAASYLSFTSSNSCLSASLRRANEAEEEEKKEEEEEERVNAALGIPVPSPDCKPGFPVLLGGFEFAVLVVELLECGFLGCQLLAHLLSRGLDGGEGFCFVLVALQYSKSARREP